MAKIDFADWLQQELDKRGWRVADLARATGLSHSHIGRILNKERLVGIEAARAIARAFTMPEDEILKIAGMLGKSWTDAANEDLTIGQIVEIVRQLDGAEREELLKYALYRLGLSKSEPDDEDEKRAKKTKRSNREQMDGT